MNKEIIKIIKKNLEKSLEKYLTKKEDYKKYMKDNSLIYNELIDTINLLIVETSSHLETINQIIKTWK